VCVYVCTCVVCVCESTSWPQATNKLQASFSVTADIGGFTAITLEISDLLNATTPAQIPVGFVNGGIACQNQSGGVYVMYSMMDVRERTNEDVADYNADHFLCVSYDASSAMWTFFNGTGWAVFISAPSDCLVATVYDASDPTSTSLLEYNRSTPDLFGIKIGFNRERSDLDFQFAPTRHSAGSPLTGEAGFDTNKVRILGHFFQPSTLTYSFTQTTGDTTADVRCESFAMVTVASTRSVRIVLAAGTILRSGVDYSMGLLIQNPQHHQSAPSFSLNIKTECIDVTLPMSSRSNALLVEAASFLHYTATQSSPFPCSSNLITVAFRTNIFIRHENGAAVHISGFSGAIVGTERLSLTDASLNARDDDDIFATESIWDDGTATGLVLKNNNNDATLPEAAQGKLKFGTSGFVIELFVKVQDWTGSPVLISNKAGLSTNEVTRGYNISLTQSVGTWQANVADGVSGVTIQGNAINDGQWHHLAMVVNRVSQRQRVELYQDMVLITSQDLENVGSVTQASESSVSIGRSTANGTTYGHTETYVTDVRFWGQSQAPITAAFFKGRRIFMPLCLTRTETLPLLIAELRFKEMSSSTDLLDSAPGSTHDGTLANPGTNRWSALGDRSPGITLCLEEGSTLEAGIEYRLSFEISNPIIQAIAGTHAVGAPTDALKNAKSPMWHHPTTHIVTYGGVEMQALASLPSTESLGMCGLSNTSDQNPMYLYEPRFTKAMVYQVALCPRMHLSER